MVPKTILLMPCMHHLDVSLQYATQNKTSRWDTDKMVVVSLSIIKVLFGTGLGSRISRFLLVVNVNHSDPSIILIIEKGLIPH